MQSAKDPALLFPSSFLIIKKIEQQHKKQNIDINNNGESDGKRVYARCIDKNGRWEEEGCWNWDVNEPSTTTKL